MLSRGYRNLYSGALEESGRPRFPVTEEISRVRIPYAPPQFPRSSVGPERLTVNQDVTGSSPVEGANMGL